MFRPRLGSGSPPEPDPIALLPFRPGSVRVQSDRALQDRRAVKHPAVAAWPAFVRGET